MNAHDHFLAEFTPLPEHITLPDRILAAYEAESCLACKEDGRLVLRLRGKADNRFFVLKMTAAHKEDLAEEYRILEKLAPLLPGMVPEPVDCFEEGGTGYLLRTYLSGQTLTQWREGKEHCPESLCVSLGQKLCALLGTLHDQQPPVIHRDIKPENIMLLPDGGVGLLDFGTARQFKDGKDTDTRHMGTRVTAAPEQYGYAQTDQRTDLYALGMTLIWLLTGQYDRDSLAESKEVSPHLRRVLEKAVAFSPEDRFQDSASFSAALAGQMPRRQRRRIIGAAVLAVVLAAAVGMGVSRFGAPPLHPAGVESPAPSSGAQAVTFTSRTMEAAVRQALGQAEGEITYDQLSQIRRLAAVGERTFDQEQSFDYRIGCFIGNEYQGDQPLGDITDSDLELLGYMPNLQELYLCRQEIKDISVLEGLPLTTLALCEDQIVDFSPLGTLTELETLYLGGNPGTDYSVLSGLNRLETLAVEGGSSTGIGAVDSLSFLDGLTLRKLSLRLTIPKDGSWEPLTRQIALEELQLWDPNEDAVAAATTLTDLKSLGIGDYYAPDLTALAGMSGLEVLGIHKGSLESLEGVESLTRLYTLSIGFNAVTDLSPLAGLPQLNYVQLEDLAVTDFSPLNLLPALGVVVVPQGQAALVEASCPGHTFQLRTY